MLAISCPSCPHLVVLNAADDRPPPWCPRCGADLKPRPVPTAAAADAACRRWNERTEPNRAVTTAPAAADALQVESPPPPVQLHEEPRLAAKLYAEPFTPSAPPPVAASTPPWVKLFAVACGIIPLLTLGGALPTAIGVGGASSCLAVARNPTMDVGTRIILCVGITVGCWSAVFLVIGGLMRFIL